MSGRLTKAQQIALVYLYRNNGYTVATSGSYLTCVRLAEAGLVDMRTDFHGTTHVVITRAGESKAVVLTGDAQEAGR